VPASAYRLNRSTVSTRASAETPAASASSATVAALTQVPAARWAAGSPSGMAMAGSRPSSRESKTYHDGTRSGAFAISRAKRS
jgi:hypothetical protein